MEKNFQVGDGEKKKVAKQPGRRARATTNLWSILFVDALLAFSAPSLDRIVGSDAPLSGVMAAIAIITFFGLLQFMFAYQNEKFSFREVIAATVLVVYLATVSWTAFLPTVDSTNALDPLTVSFTSNFTTLTGAIILFYFGSITAAAFAPRSAERRTSSHSDPERQEGSDNATSEVDTGWGASAED